MPGNITISSETVPEGFCPPYMIEKWPLLVALLSANLNGSQNTWNYGSSTPAPADQDKPWERLDGSGYPLGDWVFKSGSWIKKHPIIPGLGMLWWGDITTIATLDGGEVGAITLTTGPMWEHVTELAAKFPLGAGTLPGGTVVAIGNTGGEENHVLTEAEMPEHSHVVFATREQAESGTGIIRLAPSIDTGDTYGNTGTKGQDEPHNNMPPWAACHFIKRTARQFYRA